MFQNSSLAEMSESDLVRVLLADMHWRSRLTNIHGIPDGVVSYPETPLGDLADGDVDLLLVPPRDFGCATAVQVKVIKVHDTSFAVEIPGKLSKLSKLRQQSNLLESVGFWQVYSFVLVAVDSRANNQNQFSYAGLTAPLSTAIENAISLDGLAPRVGLVHFEFVQPMDDRPLGAGTFSARVRRLAQSAPQSAAVTEWVCQSVQRAEAQQAAAADVRNARG